MAKRLKKYVAINGEKRWFTGETEQDIILKAACAMIESGMMGSVAESPAKHDFEQYANRWFEIYSRPNIAEVTAITYRRQLDNVILPAFRGMNVEDIAVADVQAMFNGMTGKKATKNKARVVLNMIFEAAVEDGYMARNPLQSRTLKIKGEKSRPIEPYSVEEMRYIVSHIGDLRSESDRAFLALQALHPLRPEETLGLRWRDIDLESGIIHIRQVATHPDRHRAIIKSPKTEESVRDIELVAGIAKYLHPGPPDEFAVGGAEPLTYQQVKAPPHKSAACQAMPFSPSAAYSFLGLRPVSLRNLYLYLTKNSFACQPPLLCGGALSGCASASPGRSAPREESRRGGSDRRC